MPGGICVDCRRKGSLSWLFIEKKNGYVCASCSAIRMEQLRKKGKLK